MEDMEATLAVIMYSNSGQSYGFKVFRESSECWLIILISVVTNELFQRDVPMDNQQIQETCSYPYVSIPISEKDIRGTFPHHS